MKCQIAFGHNELWWPPVTKVNLMKFHLYNLDTLGHQIHTTLNCCESHNRVARLTISWTILWPSDAKVHCGKRLQHLRDHRDAIHSQRPLQFIVAFIFSVYV